MKKSLTTLLIIFLILIIGVFLIYLIASKFFEKAPPKEISIEFEQEKIPEIPKIDYLALDFELPTITEEKVKLSDYQNKIIILFFWTTWNPAGQDQIVILESYYHEVKDSQDIVILTINNQEDKSVVANFIRRGNYNLPVLLDQEGKVGEMYKITTLPAIFFINPEGKVKETYVGILNKTEIKNKVEGLYIK